MGICGSKESQQTNAMDHFQLRKKESVNSKYKTSAPIVKESNAQERSVTFWDTELVLGTRNNGWACDGAMILPGGCLTGCGMPQSSLNVKGYFDMNGDLSICTSCVERIEDDDELPNWYGYIFQGGLKVPFTLDKFVILKDKIIGHGNEKQGGDFKISGHINKASGDVYMKLKYKNSYVVDYRGLQTDDGLSIKGKWYIGNKSEKFKITLVPLSFNPWDNIELPEAEFQTHIHKCGVKGPQFKKTQWACDCRTYYSFKCLGGITDFGQAQHIAHYACKECDFDICLACSKYAYWIEEQLKNHKQVWKGWYMVGNEKTEFTLSNIVMKDKYIYGYDSDAYGDFVINGRRKRDGTIIFNKRYYKEKDSIVYSGVLSNNTHIKGRWARTNISGPFEITLDQ